MVTSKVRRARVLGVATLLVLAAFFLPVSCDVGNGADEAVAVVGTWTLETPAFSQVERWTITASSIQYQTSFDDGETYATSYRAEIVMFSNDGLNGGDTSLTAGGIDATGAGYAVIRYTEVNNVGTGEVDAFNVFRWATNGTDPAAKDFTQGSKDADLDGDGDPFTGTYTNLVFDTAEDAAAGATNANGYFAFASSGATLVQ